MKKRLEKEINRICMSPGDTLHVTEKRLSGEENEFLVDEIERSIEINKVITFDVEKGDFDENVEDGIGAAFLNVRKKNV